ncbi:MAG: GGDEF domain-containing protein [Gammaproteobacteria bacterium]|nr:GGDEF domain-containing protein [Gammaproteobacteria bacterium]
MTLLRLCALTALLFGGGMLLAAAAFPRDRIVLAHIGASNLIFVTAMVLVAERDYLGSLAGSVVLAALVVISIHVWNRGTAILLHLRHGLREPAVALALVVLPMLATAFPEGDPRLGGAAFFGVVAWMLLRHAWQLYDALRVRMSRLLRLAVIAPKLVLGGFALLRAMALMILPASESLAFVDESGPLNVILFLIIFANLVGLNVAFALLLGTNLAHTAEKLHYQSRHDLLTTLLNRRALQEMLDREIARRSRGGPAFSLLLMDIDHFKCFNDAHGHLLGDAALIHVADTLRRVARTEDIVTRFGGEEFCAMLPATGPEEALLAAERLRQAIATAPFDCGDQTRETITISIGVATHELASESWDKLIGRADAALYAAKAAGRNGVSRAAVPPPELVPLLKPARNPEAAH